KKKKHVIKIKGDVIFKKNMLFLFIKVLLPALIILFVNFKNILGFIKIYLKYLFNIISALNKSPSILRFNIPF
ncbi:MAG: hypothetical protein K0Q97_2831, partial [Bacillota bacterium]|nr:hypothetical protein [Bacillota bacterium]